MRLSALREVPPLVSAEAPAAMLALQAGRCLFSIEAFLARKRLQGSHEHAAYKLQLGVRDCTAKLAITSVGIAGAPLCSGNDIHAESQPLVQLTRALVACTRKCFTERT